VGDNRERKECARQRKQKDVKGEGDNRHRVTGVTETGQKRPREKQASGEARRKESCLLTIRVQPGAPRTEVKGLMPDGSIKVKLKAPPAEGRANAELVMLLGKLFKVPASSVKIVRGLRSRQKSVVIEGINKESVTEIVGMTIGGGVKTW
jgi:uncharacterized protein (TIGR00251 family)